MYTITHKHIIIASYIHHSVKKNNQLTFISMIKKARLIFIVTLLLAANVFAGNKHSAQTKYPSYKGLIMAGCQGWFRLPEDKVMYPDEKQVRIDMWPDVSEYEKTYP